MKSRTGFTLLELMIAVAIIGILLGIGIPQYQNLVRKSHEGMTKGNLGVLRSALSVYYGDNSEIYPSDISIFANNTTYLSEVPLLQAPPYHPTTTGMINESAGLLTDSGLWSYDNNDSDETWGAVHVGCTHLDYFGTIWSVY